MVRKNYQITNTINKNYITEDYVKHNTANFDIHYLPDEYNVIKSDYEYTKNEHTWNVSLISIYKNNNLLCEFVRNYPSISAIYVQQNNTDYLITTSNYQTITIVNLNNGVITSYTDIDDIKFGCGFCPISFDYDENTLFVEGCIWGMPYEIMTCENIDLSNPIESFNNANWSYADIDD